METEIEQAEELAAHLYSAHGLAVLQVTRLHQRQSERLKKAAQRHHAPTTLPTQSDTPQRQLRGI